MTSQRRVIGVDGGGTKSLAVLADGAGGELARRTAGASNANVVGIDQAAQHLEEAIAGCCADAGCAAGELSAVVLGLAGAGSAGNREGIAGRLRARFGKGFPVTVVTDARIAAEGALAGGPGIVVIAGTGSVVMARSASGAVRQVGGWGRAMGDEGSGYYLGLEALRALARHLDGMLPPSALPGALAGRHGWSTREHLLAAVYHEKVEPSTLAPLVMELASENDPVCLEILHRAAAALADQAAAVSAQVEAEEIVVATCGGLIERPTVYREVLAAELCARDRRFAVRMPARPAVDGAVLMALAAGGAS